MAILLCFFQILVGFLLTLYLPFVIGVEVLIVLLFISILAYLKKINILRDGKKKGTTNIDLSFSVSIIIPSLLLLHMFIDHHYNTNNFILILIMIL